ncbi:DUF4867 family protein [Agathobaculum sp. Marseille-P7918]|uniref:DUF4867 family protein n=1 Tax=Agathobaculum sp. Marseille-P7918 TaxID=2479843 RepID=UPI0035648673
MKIDSVYDPAFREYGQVITGYDVNELLKTLDQATPLPAGVEYVPEQPELQMLAVTQELQDRQYGGMPIQMGWCNGHNTELNCLEYHRNSEVNFGVSDFILLLGKQKDIDENGMFDTAKIRAFLVPAGVLVEVYATSLHYAPCSAKQGQGFKVLVVLPRGTNTNKPNFQPGNQEDVRMAARNKWLLAHRESNEAQNGAVVGLTGANIDITPYI